MDVDKIIRRVTSYEGKSSTDQPAFQAKAFLTYRLLRISLPSLKWFFWLIRRIPSRVRIFFSPQQNLPVTSQSDKPLQPNKWEQSDQQHNSPMALLIVLARHRASDLAIPGTLYPVQPVNWWPLGAIYVLYSNIFHSQYVMVFS